MKPIPLLDLPWSKSNRKPDTEWCAALCLFLLLGAALSAIADPKTLPPQSMELSVDLDPGDLVFTDSAAALIKFNPRTGESTPVLSEGMLVQPFGIAIGEDRTIYVSDTGAMGIIAIHRGASKARLLASGSTLGTPFGIAVGLRNELYVANGQAVLAADHGSGKLRMTAQGGFLHSPLGLVLAPTGELFVADASGAIVLVHPDSGEQKLVATGSYLKSPVGITSSGQEDLYVTDSASRRVVRVNAKTGQQTLVTSDGEMVTPVGVVLMGAESLLVGDPDAFELAGGIIQVDLRSGHQNCLLRGAGHFVNPRCVAVVPPTLHASRP